ncbi:hypothetical protein ACTXT7_010757, partial [Hymenolepis weldensis]
MVARTERKYLGLAPNHTFKSGDLNKVKNPEEQEWLWFYSYENNFHQDQKLVKEMIGGHVRLDLTEIPTVMRTKFPSAVMVFGVVNCEEHTMTPQFFPQSFKINTDADVYDSPPSHKVLKTQDWMAQNFHHHGTPNLRPPPNSPGLNPLDYYVLARSEGRRTYYPKATTTSDIGPTLVPDPVAHPTTPAIKVVQDPPEENLFNVNYDATANHNWVFSAADPWLSDEAPSSNFLTLSLFKRYKNNEFKNVAADIQDDFTEGSLFKALVSVTSHVSWASMKAGMFPGDSKSILLSRASKTQCIELVSDANEERPYFRRCLLNPEDCEYGLSVSLWVKFITSAGAETEQALIST